MERANFSHSDGALSDAGRVYAARPVKVWSGVCAAIAFAVAIACIAQDGHTGTGSTTQNSTATATASQAQNPVKQTKPQKASAADDERKKQISDESTQLLALAVALKAEVDKTNKDVLSLNVIRKADEIEKMARTVKEKMKLNTGPS